MDDTSIPYNTSMNAFDIIITELKASGKDGLDKATLWKRIGSMESYTLNLAKFVGLVEEEGGKARLTELGTKIAYAPEEKKTRLYIQNLPEVYTLLAKRIMYASEKMTIDELKGELATAYADRLSSNTPKMLQRAITTFVGYGRRIGLISSEGPTTGPGVRLTLTPIARQLLSGNEPSEMQIQEPQRQTTQSPLISSQNTLSFGDRPTQEYDWIILIRGRKPIMLDIETEEDFAALDAQIAAAKAKWKRDISKTKHQHNTEE